MCFCAVRFNRKLSHIWLGKRERWRKNQRHETRMIGESERGRKKISLKREKVNKGERRSKQ